MGNGCRAGVWQILQGYKVSLLITLTTSNMSEGLLCSIYVPNSSSKRLIFYSILSYHFSLNPRPTNNVHYKIFSRNQIACGLCPKESVQQAVEEETRGPNKDKRKGERESGRCLEKVLVRQKQKRRGWRRRKEEYVQKTVWFQV